MRTLTLLLCITSSIFALNLDSVLQQVKKDSNQQIQQEQQRYDEFVSNRKKQKQLLVQTKTLLKQEETKSVRLKKTIEQKEKLLAKQEALLRLKAASLGEMFGSVRQTSADFLNNYQTALTASQQSNKEVLFTQMANSKKLANIKELKAFWHSMLDEIIQSGNIRSYEADVISTSGEKTSQNVTRVGLFAAISNGKYLTYSQDMNALVELTVQPSSTALSLAEEFEAAQGISNLVVDPTRGTLFKLIENNPTILDRINQGGIVGYIILILGVLGLIFAAYKIVILNAIAVKMKKQMRNIAKVDTNNALGKIADIFYNNVNDSVDDLEIKMGQAVLQESSQIKKGQSFIKLLAAVTPLLGLLGTVTGMIATFQAITLFGTGDPKLMAGGISTALITTVLGLVTAIPLLFAYTYVASKADALVSVLEEQSIGLLAKALK
jgi:biopolymer transport protein ExbB